MKNKYYGNICSWESSINLLHTYLLDHPDLDYHLKKETVHKSYV